MPQLKALVQGQPSNSFKTKCRLVVKDWSVWSNIFMDGPSDKSLKTTVHALQSHRTPMNIKEGWDRHTEFRVCLWDSDCLFLAPRVTQWQGVATKLETYASIWRENSCKSKIQTAKCIGLFILLWWGDVSLVSFFSYWHNFSVCTAS